MLKNQKWCSDEIFANILPSRYKLRISHDKTYDALDFLASSLGYRCTWPCKCGDPNTCRYHVSNCRCQYQKLKAVWENYTFPKLHHVLQITLCMQLHVLYMYLCTHKTTSRFKLCSFASYILMVVIIMWSVDIALIDMKSYHSTCIKVWQYFWDNDII